AATVETLNAQLPSGLRVVAVREIGRNLPGLSESVRAARYLVRLLAGLDTGRAAEAFASRSRITVTRLKNGKELTFPLHAWLLDPGASRRPLGRGGGGAWVRPDEVLRAM